MPGMYPETDEAGNLITKETHPERYDRLGRRKDYKHYDPAAKLRAETRKNDKGEHRNELGQRIRADGKVDMRSIRPKDSINTSGLLSNHPEMLRAMREKAANRIKTKEEREFKLSTRDGLLAALREIAADEDAGGAKMKALELLLKPDAGENQNRCWKCKGDLAAIPPSVKEWIGTVSLEPTVIAMQSKRDDH